VNHTEKGYAGGKCPERKQPDMLSTALISVTAWCNPLRKYVLASLFDACSQRLLQQPSGSSLLRRASSPHYLCRATDWSSRPDRFWKAAGC